MAFGKLKRLFNGLSKTRDNLTSSLQTFVSGKTIDDEAIDDVEAALLAADLGPAVTRDAIDALRARAKRETIDRSRLNPVLREVLLELMSGGDAIATEPEPEPRPFVTFVVGVNGGGKTTSVGKLAARRRREGRSAIVVAADTFRAAAIEQLERWAGRAEVEIVKQREHADPASVVFDGLEAAKAKGIDHVIVDTAGRLHTKSNLMAELEKLGRVATRVVPGAPHETLLVVDATTGQNGIAQAKEFTKATRLTGVILTKLDGTAKGGVAVGIGRELGVPVRYVGVGETTDDLLEFDAESYVDGLLGETASAS